MSARTDDAAALLEKSNVVDMEDGWAQLVALQAIGHALLAVVESIDYLTSTIEREALR